MALTQETIQKLREHSTNMTLPEEHRLKAKEILDRSAASELKAASAEAKNVVTPNEKQPTDAANTT